MVDASEAIPEEGIFLVVAFEYVFRTMTPNWRELEVLASKPHLHGKERPEVMRRSDAKYDRAQLEANNWLRDRIGDRSITARICGPNGQLRQLTCEGWENVGFAENGISANFVSPDDLMNPGPDTEIDGVRYPVFFLRDEFEKLVTSAFDSAVAFPSRPIISANTAPSAAPKADVETKEKDKGGRPPEYDWDAVKAYALGLVHEHGMPGRSNRRLPTKTQLVEAILNEWSTKGMQLAEPTVRRYVGTWLKDL